MRNRTIDERNDIQNQILERRLAEVMPMVMKRNNVDMWIISSEEYNDDPLVKTFLPADYYNTRRQMIFVFYNDGATTKSYLISNPNLTISYFEAVYYLPENTDKQYIDSVYEKLGTVCESDVQNESIFDALDRFVRRINPKSIALNISENCAFANGLVYSDYKELEKRFLNDYEIKSSAKVAVDWLATRTEFEMPYYKEVIKETRDNVAKLFTKEVIKPGVTKLKDCTNFLREQAYTNDFHLWFDPTIWVRRHNNPHLDDKNLIIEEGDLLHIDYGFEAIGLNSDIQEMAYVLKVDENCAPDEIVNLHARTNKVKEIILKNIKAGKTGNEILLASINECNENQLGNVTIYCHPIGYHGHGAGAYIGRYENQNKPIPLGENIVYEHTCYSIEFNIQDQLDIYGDVTIMYGQEVDAYYDGKECDFMAGHQEQVTLI